MNDLSQTSAFARRSRRVWPMTVVDAFFLTPRKRRLRLVSELDGFSHKPGQSLVLMLPHADGVTPLRHYSVRDFDAEEQRLEIDVTLKGETWAAQWVRGAVLGDRLIAETPRGRTPLGGAYLSIVGAVS
jgi:NADPH-dependent ferric siderophore reductase